jgi:chromosome transmission fidelity protein 18
LDTSPLVDLDYFNTKNNILQENVVDIDRMRIARESEWVKKYEPRKFIELLTDDKINRNLLTWLKTWDYIVFNKHANKKNSIPPLMFNKHFNSNTIKYEAENNYFDAIFNNPKKLMLLAGPPGCGKTTLIRVLAQHCKYNIVEINASEDRSANNLITRIENITNNDTI